MSKPTLEEAYQTAFAVFSPRFRFVEWKVFEKTPHRDNGIWTPTHFQGADSWREIEGERWIYAFRALPRSSPHSSPNAAQLVDEFFLDSHKQLHASHFDSRGHRGPQVPIGDSVSVAWRILESKFWYYFFSSRVPLPSGVLPELMNKIAAWAPPVTFEKSDPGIFPGKKGSAPGNQPAQQQSKTSPPPTEQSSSTLPVVPVFDPITIATHLHAYYIAASDDLMNYLTVAKDSGLSASRKQKTTNRRKKFLLAQIVDSILDTDGTLVGLEKTNEPWNFLNDYERQVQYRKKWQDRWATILTDWLRSAPFDFLAKTYTNEDFHKLLVHLAHCHWRLNESTRGRELLREHIRNLRGYPWVEKYVLARGLSDDQKKGMLKIGSAPLELMKEHLPAWRSLRNKSVEEIVSAFSVVSVEEVRAIKIVLGKDHKGWFAWFSTEGTGFTHFIEKDEFQVINTKVLREKKLTAMWKGALTSLIEGAEMMNFAMAVGSFREKMEGDKLKEKVLGFVGLVGSGVGLTGKTLDLFELASEETVHKLSFISGAVDTVLDTIEMLDALSEAKWGKALGLDIITIGDLVVLIGLLAEGPWGLIGMALIGIGYLVKEYFRDPNEYEYFINFCSFGKRETHPDLPGAGGRTYEPELKPKWFTAKKKYEEWKDDYDEQLRAAVTLLCRFRVEPAPIGVLSAELGRWHDDAWVARDEQNYLTAKVEMAWIPKGSKLHLKFSEVWQRASDSKEFTADLEFDEGDEPKVLASNLSIKALEGGKKLVVTAPHSGKPLFDMGDEWHGERKFNGINKELKRITLTGSLEVTVEKDTFSAYPVEEAVLHGKPVSLLGIENQPGDITGGR